MATPKSSAKISPAWINNAAYTIANSAVSQATGSSAIVATDTNSFVDLGKSVLNSSDALEGFLNALMGRIAKTYFTWRPYTSTLRDLMVDTFMWGAIVQKIDAEVPDFVADETFELVDGQSVDMYVVRKPSASQKLFIKRTVLSNFVTFQRKQLEAAFVSESAFMSFIGMIEGKMRVKIELACETLARLAITNAMANTGTAQVYNLVSMYNVESGKTVSAGKAALYDNDFLRFATGKMALVSKRMSRPSVLYNKEGAERLTPPADQKFLVLDEFETALETVVQYAAYHDELVKLKSFVEVPYWQGAQSPYDVNVTNENGDSATISNVIACIFDRYALGTFKFEEENATTPYNARGRYTNSFYHLGMLWYNDMSENFVYFTLN